MAKMTVSGSLKVHLATFVDAFDGATAKGAGSILSISAGFPNGVVVTGSGITVPSSGPFFITGTAESFELTEISLAPLTFTDKLIMEDFSVGLSTLFDLISRTATTATGRFDIDQFKAFLGGETWEIVGSELGDTISAGAFYDLSNGEIITTGAGNDVIFAGEGDDRVFAGSGNDTASGEGGKDRLFGGGGDDNLKGGRQSDYLNGGKGNDLIAGGGGNDRILGGAGSDILTGSKGRDVLKGGKGKDQLDGGRGADRLEGGGGADILTGGLQNDTFVFGKGDGRDRITDFKVGSDRLELSQDLFGGVANDASLAAMAQMKGNDVVISFGGGDRVVLEDLGSIDALAGSVDFVV